MYIKVYVLLAFCYKIYMSISYLIRTSSIYFQAKQLKDHFKHPLAIYALSNCEYPYTIHHRAQIPYAALRQQCILFVCWPNRSKCTRLAHNCNDCRADCKRYDCIVRRVHTTTPGPGPGPATQPTTEEQFQHINQRHPCFGFVRM